MSRVGPPHAGLRWKALAACLALAFAACGHEEDTDHGLASESLKSDPRGDPIEVRYEVADGDTRTARIQLDMQVWQRRTGGPQPGEKRVQGTATLSLRQTFTRPAADRAPRSTVVFQYVDATGANAEAYRGRSPITGTVEHDRDGRPRPRSLRVDDSAKLTERIEALDILDSLLLAGLGGSPPWIPPHPVRAGEAWRLERFMKLRIVDNVVQEAVRRGAGEPTATFSGTARLARVEDTPRGPVLEVVIDALVEANEPYRKDGVSGSMSIGHRFRGRARIEARTGLPLSFRVTHTGSKDHRAGGEHIRQEFTSEVQGTVTQDG